MGIKNKVKKFIYERNIEKKFGKFKCSKSIKNNWHKKFLNRIALINAAVSKILIQKKKCNYLEIGCDDDYVFKSVMLPDSSKVGIDPVKGGNLKIKSDVFFKKNKKRFDIIFIDGLHHYDQCQRDVINSINFLNKNGYIFIHDLIPLDWRMELVPRIQGRWSGDVWKVGYELSMLQNLKFYIADIDSGVGFFKKKNKIIYEKIKRLENCRFKDFLKIYKKLPILEANKALHKIIND